MLFDVRCTGNRLGKSIRSNAVFKCRLNAQLIGNTAKKVLNERSSRSASQKRGHHPNEKPRHETRQFCDSSVLNSSWFRLARLLLCNHSGGSQRCGGTRWLHKLRRGLKEGKVRKLACSRSHGCVARAGSSCRENCFGGSRGGKGDGFVHPLFCCAMLFLRAITHYEDVVSIEPLHSQMHASFGDHIISEDHLSMTL
jgi:hypothetical protein